MFLLSGWIRSETITANTPRVITEPRIIKPIASRIDIRLLKRLYRRFGGGREEI
jgi:hypothetical protein